MRDLDTEAKLDITTDAMKDWVVGYCEENSLCVYGDHRDELPGKIAENMLEGNLELFDDWLGECETNARDFDDYWCDDFTAAFCHEFADGESIFWDDIPDEVTELAMLGQQVDMSDFVRVCLNNSAPHIVAIIKDENGEEFYPPNGTECDREDNVDRIRCMRSIGIRNPWKCESLYSHETLKALGTIDMNELYRNLCAGKKLVGITLYPDTHILTHTSWNGSGGLGNPRVSKEIRLHASFVYDNGKKYGVGAVYGFVHEVWGDELAVTYE